MRTNVRAFENPKSLFSSTLHYENWVSIPTFFNSRGYKRANFPKYVSIKKWFCEPEMLFFGATKILKIVQKA